MTSILIMIDILFSFVIYATMLLVYCAVLYGRMAVSNELERIWKEAALI
jgi:hypothetical protein